MAKYHYRCSKSKCRKRVTRRKKLEEYILEKYKVCPRCGNDSLKPCPSVKLQIRRDVCKCDGFPYSHKMGSKSGDYICRHYDIWKDLNKEIGAVKIKTKDDEVPF